MNKLFYGEFYKNSFFPESLGLYLGFRDLGYEIKHFMAVKTANRVRIFNFFSHSFEDGILKSNYSRPARLRQCEREFVEKLLENKLKNIKTN